MIQLFGGKKWKKLTGLESEKHLLLDKKALKKEALERNETPLKIFLEHELGLDRGETHWFYSADELDGFDAATDQ